MSNISSIIELNNFEIIRTKIAQILAAEIANQIVLIDAELALPATTEERAKILEFYKASLPTSVWEDRFLDPGEEEMPFMNVVFVDSPQDENISHETQIGTNTYIVEMWQTADTTSEDRGDSLSSHKLARLAAVGSTILKDRSYIHLDLGTLIGWRQVTGLEAIQPSTNAKENAANAIYGKFKVSVKVGESIGNKEGILLESSTTNVVLNETELGYQWFVE